jgi:hypothetical protein
VWKCLPVVEGLQSFFFQVDITEIVFHKADEPDTVVDFLDADRLASQASTYVDLFAIETKASAVGDHQDCGSADLRLRRTHRLSIVQQFNATFSSVFGYKFSEWPINSGVARAV